MKQHVTKTCQLAYMELKKNCCHSPLPHRRRHKNSCFILHSFEVRLLQLRSPRVPFKCHSFPPTHTKLSSPSHLQIALVPTLQPSSEKLHWLPVEERIIYKCCCLCFKVLTGDAPAYLSDLLHVYVPSRTLLSSTDTRIFRLPNHCPNRKQHGKRTFSYAAVHHWNNLPYTVRHCQSLSTFKTLLKTHLFSKHFC